MNRIIQWIKQGMRQLSIRFALLCVATILPINLLSVCFCVLLYQNHLDDIITDYQTQVNAHANILGQELSGEEASIESLFAAGSFHRFAFDEISDPSVATVALKSILSRAQISNSTYGICYVWNHNSDIISVFHNNHNYGFANETKIKEIVRKQGIVGGYSTVQNFLEIDGFVFAGSVYCMNNYSIGVYMDVGTRLREFYDYSMEPRGTIALIDHTGRFVCSYSKNGFSQENIDLQSDEISVFVQAELDYAELYMVEYVNPEDQGMIMRLFPIILLIYTALTLICFLVFPIVFIGFKKLYYNPVYALAQAMQEVGKGNMEIQLPEKASTEEIEVLNTRFNQMVTEIRNLRIRSYEQQILKLKTDAINLKLQVNPHMFLNSLNIIYSLSRLNKTEQLCDFSVILMDYFRYLLRSNSSYATIKDEMGFVSSYLGIQQVRFPDKISFGFAVDEDAEHILIPRLLIENFVENAAKYSIKSERITEIFVRVEVNNDRLNIVVIDNGNGIHYDVLRQIRADEIVEDETGKHIGIWNCRRRLNYYYQGDYKLDISSKIGEGTRIELILPIEPKVPDEE